MLGRVIVSTFKHLILTLLLILQKPGTIDAADFQFNNSLEVHRRPVAPSLLSEIRKQCADYHCNWGVITDEVVSVLYQHDSLTPIPDVCLINKGLLFTNLTVRMAIA